MEMKNEYLKATGISWIASIILLLIGTIYEIFIEGSLSIVSIILSIVLVVYFGSLIYFRQTTSKDH